MAFFRRSCETREIFPGNCDVDTGLAFGLAGFKGMELPFLFHEPLC
jgi:hypothetical protein